jgi:hypothetical protein
MPKFLFADFLILAAASTCGGATAPERIADRAARVAEVKRAIPAALGKGPSRATLLGDVYGDAVCPPAGKGGLGVGGVHPWGKHFERGEMARHVSLPPASMGSPFAGQAPGGVVFPSDGAALGPTRGRWPG